MKSLCFIFILLSFCLNTMGQTNPPPSPAGPEGTGTATTSTTTTTNNVVTNPQPLPTDLIVFPLSLTNSQVNIVVENPPAGIYILELVEPPAKIFKSQIVTNTNPILYDLQSLDTDNVPPGSYVVRYQGEGGHMVKPVTIVE